VRRKRAGRTVAAVEPSANLALVTVTGHVVHAAPQPICESLRYMLARLRLSDGTDLPGRVGLTSTVAGEGVTYVTRSLALVLANDTGRRVCIVDLNWADPAPWPDEAAGVAGVLRGQASLDEAVLETGTPGVFVLPCGGADQAERPGLAQSDELDSVLAVLSETFDHVLLDLPAVTATSEALSLVDRSRSVMFVVGHGAASRTQVASSLEHLSGVSVLGVILNRSASRVPEKLRHRLASV
jgi:Mrp family chromosome partitioning ATPase